QIAIDYRRAAAAVLADVRPQVAAPDVVAVVVQRDQRVFFRRSPRDIQPLFVDARRARGEAVELVLGVWSRLELSLPNDLSVGHVEAKNQPRGRVVERAD